MLVPFNTEVTMRPALALLLALSVATAAPLPFPKSRGKSDLEALQGEWAGVQKTLGGKDQGDGQRMAASVSAARIAFSADGEVRSSWGFKLDPTKSPKHMDLTGFGSRPLLAVYRVEGDTLTLAYVGVGKAERPADFEGKKQGGWVLLFKRKR
jgi:uncharacterized protein (TIGR03067 family)